MVLSTEEEGRWNEVVTELHNDIIEKKIARGIVLWLFLFTFFLKVIFAEIISSNNFVSVLKVFFR